MITEKTFKSMMRVTIIDMEFSKRTTNCLLKNGYKNIRQLFKMRNRLNEIKNLTLRSRREIELCFRCYGLTEYAEYQDQLALKTAQAEGPTIIYQP